VRFFKPDLLARFGSDDIPLAQVAQDELEHRSEEYVRALQEIGPTLPPRLRDLLDQYYLHDARVINQSALMMSDLEWLELSVRSGMATRGIESEGFHASFPSYWIPLRLDTPPGEILMLQYRSVQIEKAEIHESLLEPCPYLEWQYDEVDVIRSGESPEFRHSILFTRGLELQLRFKDFDFAALKPMETPGVMMGVASMRRGV
jgi:hypothetical protein